MSNPHPLETLSSAKRSPAMMHEIAYIIAAREAAYPPRVAKGHMTQQEADYQRAIAGAIANDVARFLTLASPTENDAMAMRAFTWEERCIALEREAALRQRQFTELVAKGHMTQQEADEHNAALEAIYLMYTHEMFEWRAGNGALCRWGATDATEAEEAARAEFRAVWKGLDDARMRRSAQKSVIAGAQRIRVDGA
jgi:hypothetical protein